MRGRKTKDIEEIDKLIVPLRDFCRDHKFSLVLRATNEKGRGPCLIMGSPDDIKADIDTIQMTLIESMLEDLEKDFKEIGKRKDKILGRRNPKGE